MPYKDPEKAKAYLREYGKRNAHRRRQWYHKNKAEIARYVKEWKEQFYEKAAGRPRSETCELCFKAAFTQFDHCHETGCFRGWICAECNKALGLVRDNAELLRRMADYVEKEGSPWKHNVPSKFIRRITKVC